jgi:hypothetical protein
MLSATIVHAQTSTAQQAPRLSVFADIRSSTIRAVGAQIETVEVTAGGAILTVLRVNSNLNESTHAGRDNEANVIASIVAKAISDNPEFQNLTTIRVQYVAPYQDPFREMETDQAYGKVARSCRRGSR